MSKLRIKDAPLLPDVDGTEKIPTGGKGDYSVTVEQLKVFAQGGLPQQLQEHINDFENPHNVTKDQVGLGNVDNTSDVNKPISSLTQEALDLKADESYVDEELNLKADKTYVDSELNLKANSTDVDNALDLKLDASEKGESGGVATLDSSGKVPRDELPNFVDLTSTVPTFNTPEAGVDPVTGVADGTYFNVRSSNDDSYVDEYQNIGGSAVATGKRYLSALGVEQQEKPASTIKDASGKNQQEINNHVLNFPFILAKDYGVVADGVTDSTLALMNVCAAFSTGTLLLPPGKIVINYDTLNPHFASRVGSLVNSTKCRSPMFFGLKNATIWGYGTEIFVKNNAKTIAEYDATFGVFMNVGGCEDFYCLGLKIDGNAFNQPVPSATFNTLYIPRNHGFTFFNKDNGVYNNIHFYDNVFKELGWHDARNLSSGDNAGDGVLFFGIKNLTNLYIERNKFLDIGRWAVAVDILTDHIGMYKNININQNLKISEKNLQFGYSNITRELGFYDHEVACGFDTVNVCDNILINGRPAIRIGGSERQNSTTQNIRCTIARNTIRVDHEHKWYMFGVSDQRNYQEFSIYGNNIQIQKQNFPFFVGSNTAFYGSSFDKNVIRIKDFPNPSGISVFPLLMPGGGQRGAFSCSGNIFDGIGFYFSDPTDLAEPLTLNVSGNDFYNCSPVQGGLINTNVSLYFTANTFHRNAKYNSVSCTPNETGASAVFEFDNLDLRQTSSSEPERLNGKIIVKNPVNFVPRFMQPVSGSYMGYYLAGDTLLNYPSPQNNYRELVCLSEGICLNTTRGDKAWVAGEVIAAISGYYGPVYRTNNNNVYQARTTGTTGGTPPTHTTGDVSDGGVTWRYIGKVAQFSPSGFISLQASVTYDPPSLAAAGTAGDVVVTTVTLTGAAVGDNVDAAFSRYNSGIRIYAVVSAANTVTIEFRNISAAPIDLASGTLRVKLV